MKLILLLIIPVLMMPGADYKVKSSAVTFRIKNAGIQVDGSFSGLEADIRFDPLKPEETRISASVNSASINTGNSMRDGHLRKAEYFDAATYPKIKMVSQRIEKTGPISFNGIFRLTIKGTTKDVKVPFNFMKVDGKTQFKGSFTINRLDYAVGESSFTLSDNATITIVLDVTE